MTAPTAVAAPPAHAPAPGSDDVVSAATLWRRWRGPLVVAALVVGLVALLAALGAAPPARPLDPADASPDGGRALAQLLDARGVHNVRVTDATAAATGTTGDAVVVPEPYLLADADLRMLAAGRADLLVVMPDATELEALGVTATEAGGTFDEHVAPGCTLPAAVTAGDIRADGPTYDAPGPSVSCYRGTLVVAADRPARTLLLGSVSTLSNRWLAQRGDAALGLGLLGGYRTIRWLVAPNTAPPPPNDGGKGLLELLPGWLLWSVLQLAVAVAVLALWRARRLGPVVVEPLPVVVRAAETLEGRGRLLRAAGSRGSAAGALRAGVVRRLASIVGAGAAPERTVLVDAVSARTGRATTEVDEVLYGPDPPDDAALIRLARDLDALETAVRTRNDDPHRKGRL